VDLRGQPSQLRRIDRSRLVQLAFDDEHPAAPPWQPRSIEQQGGQSSRLRLVEAVLRRCVPRATVASPAPAREGPAGAIESLPLPSDASNGRRRRTAIHASELWRRIVAQTAKVRRRIVLNTPLFMCRSIFVQESESGCRRIATPAPRPATIKATTAPITMRREAPFLIGRGRDAFSFCGFLGAVPAPGSALAVSPRQGTSETSRRRHAEQSPRSPGVGVCKAPQLEHP